MITPETLQKAGWAKMGNAWYKNGNVITNYDGKWFLWKEGIKKEITTL